MGSEMCIRDRPEGEQVPRPGDFVTVPVTRAAAYHLIADPQPVLAVRGA